MDKVFSTIIDEKVASVYVTEEYSQEWDYTAQAAFIRLTSGFVFEIPNEDSEYSSIPSIEVS